MQCPTRCSGRGPNKQRNLTDGELSQVPKRLQNKNLRRCMHCGAVYDFEERQLGWLDASMMEPGWHDFKGMNW